jgi:hypothetical protein
MLHCCLGIVSNRGQHPFPSKEQEDFLGVGPMCRFAADLLPTLKIIAGKNIDRLQLDTKVSSSYFILLLLINFHLHVFFSC